MHTWIAQQVPQKRNRARTPVISSALPTLAKQKQPTPSEQGRQQVGAFNKKTWMSPCTQVVDYGRLLHLIRQQLIP